MSAVTDPPSTSSNISPIPSPTSKPKPYTDQSSISAPSFSDIATSRSPSLPRPSLPLPVEPTPTFTTGTITSAVTSVSSSPTSADLESGISTSSSGQLASSSTTLSSAAFTSSFSPRPIPTVIPNTSQTRGQASVPMASSTSEPGGSSGVDPGPSVSGGPTPGESSSSTISRTSTRSNASSTSSRPTRSSSSTPRTTVTSVTRPVTRRPTPGPSITPSTSTRLQTDRPSSSGNIDNTVTTVRLPNSSTSTVFVSPQTTLSSAVLTTLTDPFDGSEVVSTPEYVTVIYTSTEADGDVVTLTHIAANPTPSSDEPNEVVSEVHGSILNNKGAAAGIFVAVGLVSSIISFLLFMIWRRRRRTEQRKQWFAGMRQQQQQGGFGGYPFDGSNREGSGEGAGDLSRKNSSLDGLKVERTVEDDRGLQLPWNKERQPSPPQQHYRPHSTITGNNMGNQSDSLTSLGLAGIGADMFPSNHYNVTPHHLRPLPSPARKPVSTHLYEEELKELDAIILSKKEQSNPMQHQHTRSNSGSEDPANAVRTRFGLPPIDESERITAYLKPTSIPPSSFNYNARFAPSPAPSSPSLYPPTLPEDSDPYAGYEDDDDDDKNLFYQRPALASGVGSPTVLSPVPPRPPRSRLRESTNSNLSRSSTLESRSRHGHGGSFGSGAELAQAKQEPALAQRPKIGVNIADLFSRNRSNDANGKKPDFIPLTPPSSSGPSPLYEKHQDILTNRKTLLDVRPRSIRSTASSN